MASKHVTSNQFKQSQCWKQTPSAGNANKPISTWKPKNTVIPFQGGSSSRLALDSRDTAKHLTIISHGGESIYPPLRHDYFRQCLGSGSALTRNILAPGAGTDKTAVIWLHKPDPLNHNVLASWFLIRKSRNILAQGSANTTVIWLQDHDTPKLNCFGSWIRIQMLWV